MNVKAFFSSIIRRGILLSTRILYYEIIFDKVRGTKTGITSKNRNGNYMPSSYLLVRNLFRELRLYRNLSELVLIDFGSGKGRVLIIALEEGFQKVYGIDKDYGLYQNCKSNFEKYKMKMLSSEVTLVHDDVVNFKIPDEVNVYYLYNPFSVSIFKEILEKIARSDSDGFIIYLNPLYHDIILKYGFRETFRLKSKGYLEAIVFRRIRAGSSLKC